MLFPGSSSPHFDPQLFANPTVHYRGIPFWSWNCVVTEELIDRQLDMFKEMGFGGVDIHPRLGLNTPYLSERFMQLIRYAVQRCKEKGLLCWLYDDDRFPSGAAAGLLTRERRYRQRYLLLTEQHRPDFLPDQTAYNQAIAENRDVPGWFAACYALRDGACRRVQPDEQLQPGERLRYAYVTLLEPEDWFQGQTYVDVMDPEAIRAFLDMTHEYYFREIGSEFGGAVPAIFTDEPRMDTRSRALPKRLADADSHGDVILPWSDCLYTRLQEEHGLDLLDIAPALVWELPESPLARYHFRDTACEQFVSAFMDQIARWCTKHNIQLTGHVLDEDSLYEQSMALGECMRCYRSMDIPGIDVLCDSRQFLTAKQAVSVARQMQREGVVSELYGVTQWNCDFKTFKLQGDWQAALGVNIRVPHLSWMSMEGEAKRDWPGSIFYQAPWWKEFRAVEDYFARLNTALTRGTPLVQAAVLHPVESLWLHQGSTADAHHRMQELSDRFDCLIEGLLANLTDFDLISESLLPGQQPRCDQQGLHVGAMVYQTVIVPDMETIRSTTLHVLEDFHRQGGRIIFAGTIPHLVDAQPSDRAARLARDCRQAAMMTQLTDMLDENAPISVRLRSGAKPSNLLCQLRQDGETRWVFLCHAHPRKNRIATPEDYTIRLKGSWRITCCDALTGQLRPLPCRTLQGETICEWEAYAQDSLLLQLTPGCADDAAPPMPQASLCAVLRHPESITLQEPNMLLLDYASASLDGGAFSPKEEILQLDNHIRRQLGFKLRHATMTQPYALEERESHQLVLRYEIFSETEALCQLALEHPERCAVYLNGTAVPVHEEGWYVDMSIRRIGLPALHTGVNLLELHLPYNQKTNLENMYLLGDFDVIPRSCAESILTPRRCKHPGNLTPQGMPFYSGVVTYRYVFDAPADGDYMLHVPEFAAALLVVRADGTTIGQIAYAPHRIALNGLSRGAHQIEIDAYLGRHNGFGTVHNSNDQFVWYGPRAWRTQGDEWTDDYRLLPGGILSAPELYRPDESPSAVQP